MKYRLPLLVALLAAESLVTLAILLQPSSEGNSAVLGYSLPRLAVIGLLVLLAIALGAFAARLFRSDSRRIAAEGWLFEARRLPGVIWIALIVAVVGWVALWLPVSSLGDSAGYIERLRPLFALLVLGACEALGLFAFEGRARSEPNERTITHDLRGWGIVVGILLLAWGLIALTRLGFDPRGEDYWYEAGVPVLSVHVLLALGVGVLALLAWGKNGEQASFRRTDIIIFLAIWFLAGLLWMRTPAPNGYFNPGPFPPTLQSFPFSDAARYDLESQFALIGQQLNNNTNLGRPAYAAFLVLMHVLAGQDFDLIINIQTALFAIFPALIYLLAKALFNRSAGLAAAALILLRGVSSIEATAILNLANPKQMLSDFPVAIGIALTLLLCILWFNSPGKLRLPLLAGAAIMFTIYLRQTALGVVPAILVVAYLANRKIARAWWIGGLALFLGGVILAAAPWELRSNDIGGMPFYPSSLRKIIIVLQNRYPDEVQPTPYAWPATPSAGQPTPAAGRSWPPAQWNRDNFPQDGDSSGAGPWDSPYSSLAVEGSQLDAGLIANHFLHNVVTSVLTLPDSFALNDLRTTVKAENSYWNARWDGSLTPGRISLLALNLVWLALGLFLAWKHQRFAGLLPAGAFLGYHLANAFGRTSGGRYIVPVDWIVAVYFILGLTQAVIWCLRGLGLLERADARVATSKPLGAFKRDPLRTAGWTALCVLLAGALLVLPDYAFPKVYASARATDLLEQVAAYGPEQVTPGELEYIDTLMERGGVAFVGRIMYPRYAPRFASGEMFFTDLFTTDTPMVADYPVLAFTLIGPKGATYVRLIGPLSDNIPHLSDAIVFGCKQYGHIEAATVIVQGPPVRTYTRSPYRAPRCTLSEPVCDQNGNCR